MKPGKNVRHEIISILPNGKPVYGLKPRSKAYPYSSDRQNARNARKFMRDCMRITAGWRETCIAAGWRAA